MTLATCTSCLPSSFVAPADERKTSETLAALSFAASSRFLMRDWLTASAIVSPKTDPAFGAVRLTKCSPRSSKKANSGTVDASFAVDALETMLGTTALFSRIFWLPFTE